MVNRNPYGDNGEQRVVLITGASSGIGLAMAKELKNQGLRVIATARRPEAVAELKEQGFDSLLLDVTDAGAIEEAVNSVKTLTGRLDILINNAGYGLVSPIVEVPMDKLEHQFRVNTFAPLRLIQTFLPLMRKGDGGVIVNIGSVSGVLTTPFSGAYCASKAALHALSDALRMELDPFGIRVITVQPGGIRSLFGEKAERLSKELLRSDSLYLPIKNFIEERANASQENATSAEEFAAKVVKLILKKNPPLLIRVGKKSKLMPFLKWFLPIWFMDRILKKKFGLRGLKYILQGG